MTALMTNATETQNLGADWLRALVTQDFNRLAGLCQPEVRSRTMTPKRVDTLENADELTRKVEGWFKNCSFLQVEQSRIGLVGEKLTIFYRLSFEEDGQPYQAEQQLFCTLRDGRIDQLSLLCSGFQPVRENGEAPIDQAKKDATPVPLSSGHSPLQADASLRMDTAGGQGSTCAILTPAIKRKLSEMVSGQVLEVQVDDPTAKEDIEAWCRLSGNRLLQLDRDERPNLRFYLMKK